MKEAYLVNSGFGLRYVSVPGADSREGYQDMEDFIDTVADQSPADSLSLANNGRGAFRRFKYVLAQSPGEQERWFQFHDNRLRQGEMDIEPV